MSQKTSDFRDFGTLRLRDFRISLSWTFIYILYVEVSWFILHFYIFWFDYNLDLRSYGRSSRKAWLLITIFAFVSPFLHPSFLGGKRKGEKNNQSRDQKAYHLLYPSGARQIRSSRLVVHIYDKIWLILCKQRYQKS